MQFVCTATFTLLLAKTASAYLTPYPLGKHNVSLTTGSLTDSTRHGRQLMLSIFQPATCASTVSVPGFPNKTATYQGPWLEKVFSIPADLSPLFLDERLPVCPNHPKDCSPLKDAPILLFSPGYGTPRLYYNVLASSIARQGFTVITIDHPNDANIITYPDGHTVYNNETAMTDDVFAAHLPARVTDLSFVIDQLHNKTATAKLLPHQASPPFRTDRIAAFGHSLGGVTAVLAASKDRRILGASNWDGTFVRQPPPSGVSQPVLLISHGGADDSWREAWPLLEGPKLWVNVANATHETFSDVATLVQAHGYPLDAFAPILGSIKPAEMVKILTGYTSEWMRGVFAGKIGGPLVEGKEGGQFPEVTVLGKADF